MTTFFQRLFRGGKSATGSAEPRLALAAFGKHPGWDDYLGGGVDTGIGVNTGTLVQVKQALHAEGIRGQIDSGAWEKLEPEKRLEGFDHAFLWLRAGHVILGQIWSSTDGKHRRYPMVLCIDAEGVPPEFLLVKARPELKKLRAACQTATTAEQVTAECHAAQDRLRALLTGSVEMDSETLLPIQARRRFLAHPALGPEQLGMLRALHELGTTPGIFTSRGGLGGAGRAQPRTGHLRVPLASDLRNEGLSLWATFLRRAIPDAVPLLLISRSGVDWIDVVIGEPVSDDFFWLQASLKGAPLTTEIPFELSPDLKPLLEDLEARFFGAKPPAAAEGPPPVTKVAAPDPALAPRAAAPAPTPLVTPAPAPVAKPTTPATASVTEAAAPTPAGVSADSQVQEMAARRNRAKLLAGGGAVVIAAAGLFWFDSRRLSSPAALTVTAESGSRAYGEANPPLTGDVAGLLDGDGITVDYKTMADARSPTGRYDIVAVLNDPNRKLGTYRVTTTKGTLTITPAELKVAASNQSRPYGSSNPPLTGSIQGLRNGDGITVTSHTKADVKSGAGSCDIVPDLNDPASKLSNYAVTTNNAILTITPVALAISANNQRRAYRAANPPLTVSIEGLRNGDGITATSHTKADENSPVGNYDIEPEIKDPANRLGNYPATINKGILTITPAALTVTANNHHRAYAATNPPLTGWITPNADQISAAYSTVVDPSSPAGDYPITPVLRDPKNKVGNYAVTTNVGWLTITPAAVTSVVPAKSSGDGAMITIHDELARVTSVVPAKSSRDARSTFTNGIGMEFVLLSVVPPNDVYIGRYEVTQKQYHTLMGQLPTFQPDAGDNLPVVNVAFKDAQEFCSLLTARERKTYALPSREEWLAAAQLSEDQVGNAWSVITDRGMLQREVTSVTETRSGPEVVGSRGAQTNGLCDLFGNVREWVIGVGKDGNIRGEGAGFSYYSRLGPTKFLFRSPPDPQEAGFRCSLRK